ncbi:alpha/beta-hydrolase family protein [Pseudoclavibacter soli]|uniref:alpha/beta-hydrolase family protein n=1 Tax=Pseudoclavibacter soli TaxID=452623 RepID=UPI000414C24F|nr:alpha/beta-hydrolase family protein [Pseudoclavibacter soli]
MSFKTTFARASIRTYRWITTVLGARFDLVGLVFGLNLFWMSLTPSLMPRDWYWQGLISGVLMIVGYAIGVAVRQVVRWIIPLLCRWWPTAWRWSPRTSRRIGLGFILGMFLINLYWLIVYVRWQQSVYPSSGFVRPDDSTVGSMVTTTLMVCTTLALAWGVLAVFRLVTRLIGVLWHFLLGRHGIHRLPSFIGYTVSVLAVALVAMLVFNTALRPFVLNVVDGFYTAKNSRTAEGVQQPTSPLKSGSDASLVSWDELGWPGKQFVAGSPTTDDIQQFNPGEPTTEPIRVYVGKEFSDNITAQARIAVAELERTGAFDREAVQIVVTTGTGWVNSKAARPLEYLYNGDIATVAIQYSYLPSAFSLLLDRDRVAEAATQTITGVKQAIADHAAASGHSPKLYIFGESLGSNGIEQSAPSLADLVADTDGVLLAGPPGFNPLHQRLTDARDGTAACVQSEGVQVQFISGSDEPDDCSSPTQLLYLQNTSDAVVKWNASLAWREPAWITAEQAAGQLSPYVVWRPGITWVQVTLDMLISSWAPDRYGHNYGSSAVRAWLHLTDAQWSEERIEQLEATIQ